MPKQIQGSQFDFSFGEVDTDLKRCDSHPARKGGLRQMVNARIHNSGTIQNRSGRSALYPAPAAARTDELTMTPGNDFKLEFGAGQLRIMNSAGAQVALFTLQGSGAALPWTALNTNQIVYAIFGLKIYLTFGFAMQPQVVTWDGVATWTIADYVETVTAGGQKRTPFYRISPPGITLQPSSNLQNFTGTLIASAPLFTAAMVGTRLLWIGRQMSITAFTDSTHVTAINNESLNGSINIVMGTSAVFSIGDVVNGSISGAKLEVTQIVNANTIAGNLLTGVGFTNVAGSLDIIIGPGGSSTVTAGGVSQISPQPSVVWTDEIMNSFRGFPASVFVDQFRVGFCDFPAVPGGICWSAINSPVDLYIGTIPNAAMFEIAPNKVRVYYVVPGPEGSEFVLCDKRVYYIPINETNPLKPGSVAFKTLTGDGAARVKPHIAQEAILYVNAGGSTIMAIIATGAYLRPFNTKSLTDFHAHLFKNIQCIAAPNADGQFNERYAYVLNGDGSIAVGKYYPETLIGTAPVIGWGPWSGAGTVKWIHAWGQDVLFTTSYFGATICEILDDSVYMDASLFVNALPASFTPPGGKGPLWWIPNQSVFLMDQVSRPMGVYQIDANGFIIPQNNGGENLLAASLVAGQIWTGIAEPFAPDATSGADMKQRMELRQYSKYAVYLIHSTGLIFANIFSGKQTRTSAIPGVIMEQCRVPAYNMDDDTTIPPFQRETVESWTPPGSSFDPRCAVMWDKPGPIQILEFAMEISI